MDFKETVRRINETRNPDRVFPGTVMAFDPGETTGVAVMTNLEMTYSCQLITPTQFTGIHEIKKIIETHKPNMIICENYRIYGWATKQHQWAELHTPKLIGCIVCLAVLKGVPIQFQMAVEGKGWVTDQKLKAWGFYERGEKHARDAMRHACYYLLFGDKPKK